MFGSVTRQSVCQPVAPSTTAASSSSRLPCACISGISSRAMNGKVTKIGRQHDARHREDDLHVVLLQPRPEPALQPEDQHIDEARHDRRDREWQVDQGVISSDLPLKSYLAIAHAAATPKTRLAGTAIAAAVSVRRIADSASGSAIDVR